MAGYNHFSQIAGALHSACSKVVRKTCFDGMANIQGFIRANGQIDTGFLLNSVYVTLFDESTYSGGEKALDAVEHPPDDVTGYIAVAANYGIWQNYGTRFQKARPFFEPGIEQTRPGFVAAVAAIQDALAEAAR